MKSVPLTAMILDALDKHAPHEAMKFRGAATGPAEFRTGPAWATALEIGERLGGKLGEACRWYADVLRDLESGDAEHPHDQAVERAVQCLAAVP